MGKLKKLLCTLSAGVLLISLSAMSVFAESTLSNPDDLGTEISANIQGADSPLGRASDPSAAAITRGSTDIIDDNHAFDKAVEVWGVTKTWLDTYISGTANGIPDWTLMAMCQLWVSNGTPSYVTSPTASVYDQASVTATTKKVNAKDGGNASATGSHTVKNFYHEIVWSSETKATENF